MHKIGTPSYIIQWCKNFISDRTFKVKVGKSLSQEHNILAGVPQGCVLSPLLFSIYINDTPGNSKLNDSNSLLFADDLLFYKIFKNQKNVCKYINRHLIELQNWLNKWRLLFATHKCKYMIFEKTNSTTSFDLVLYEQKIEKCNEQMFLGIVFDNKLNFSSQIAKITDTCSKRLNLIKILSHKSWKLGPKTLIKVYLSLIRSIFDFSAILNPAISATRLYDIQKIQNNAFRLIFNKPFDTRISTLHELAKVGFVQDRFKHLSLRYILKAINNNNPIIKDAFNEYTRFANGRILTTNTLFCQHKNKILDFIQAINNTPTNNSNLNIN